MWGKNSANVTDASAVSVHGTNPQNLIEKILRSKIYNHAYWKEHCFGLTAESLVDKAMEIEAIGGTFGGVREPSRFIQLMLKMLQIQPEKEIVVEFIKNEDYKYVRALGAYYMRLTGRAVEVYQYLEPLYNDYRKLRRRMPDGTYSLTRMDEFIDECLREDYLLDIALPHLPRRLALEANGQLAGARRSALEDDLDELEAAEAAEAAQAKAEADAANKAAAEAAMSRLPPPPPPPPPESRRRDEGQTASTADRDDPRDQRARGGGGGGGGRADERRRDDERGGDRGGGRGRYDDRDGGRDGGRGGGRDVGRGGGRDGYNDDRGGYDDRRRSPERRGGGYDDRDGGRRRQRSPSPSPRRRSPSSRSRSSSYSSRSRSRSRARSGDGSRERARSSPPRGK